MSKNVHLLKCPQCSNVLRLEVGFVAAELKRHRGECLGLNPKKAQLSCERCAAIYLPTRGHDCEAAHV